MQVSLGIRSSPMELRVEAQLPLPHSTQKQELHLSLVTPLPGMLQILENE